jgi:hypothetical protein
MKIFKNRILFVVVVAAVAVAGCNGGEETPPNDTTVPRTAAAMADGSRSEGLATSAADVSLAEVVTVYKSPTCGCCSQWVEHMREAGFQVETHDMDDVTPVKVEHGISPRHQSCHTAVVGDYVLEGHVPADLVRRMLEERPEIAGLAVPGMPVGSPGMETPDGAKNAYDVIAFTEDGGESVYASR